MINKKINFTIVSLLILIISSCTTNDPSITNWKADNAKYFANMKDSTGYVLYNVPAQYGGYSYYYKIITPGDQNSTSPLATDIVKVNYRGSLINGTVFDQTYTGNSPIGNSAATPYSFGVNNLILGWTFNLMQMKIGEVRVIVLPSELAYSSSLVGVIQPYSTLRFTIHLVSIAK